MINRMDRRHQCLCTHLLDLLPDFVGMFWLSWLPLSCKLLIDVVKDGINATLVASVVHCFVLILLVLGILFVDGVVCQMHIQVLQVASLGSLILNGGKARQTFFVDEAP